MLSLISVGLVALSSASLTLLSKEHFFEKQLFWLAFGFLLFVVGMIVDLDFLKKHAKIILYASFILLILVLIPGLGRAVNGSRRWIGVGGINFQASEFAKIAIIIWLACYISESTDKIKLFFDGFLYPLMICGATSGLIFLEPDYGTAVLIAAVALTVLYINGTKSWFLLAAMCIGVALVALLVFLSPVRMRRITSFLDVDSNKLEGAYQLWQGILGFAAGGISGRGIGEGRQQLLFLPEAHTDFIFSIIGEELGLICSIAITLIYAAFFVIAIFNLNKINDRFRVVLGQGAVMIITLQAIINIGVVTGILPTKGMVLPFISYGGSNLIVVMFAVGIILNCLRHRIIEEA